jgi:hypothetical protein
MTFLFAVTAVLLFTFQHREAAHLIALLAIAVGLVESANIIRRTLALPFITGSRRNKP